MSSRLYRVIVVGTDLFTDLTLEAEILSSANAELVDLRAAGEQEIQDELTRADAVISEFYDFDRATLESMTRCSVIARYAVGNDRVDLEAATDCGIAVANAPGYCTSEVADHTLLLMLALARRLRSAEAIARTESWNISSLRPIHRLSGAVLGLIGIGRIGQAVARRAQAMDMTVLAHDPYRPPGEPALSGVSLVPIRDLLRRSDVISLHLPLSAATRGLVNAGLLGQLKSTAMLINVSRGELIDQESLLHALDTGQLAGAAFDVLAHEPPKTSEQLLQRENVICTPHMAYYSEEAVLEVRRTAAEQVAAALTGRVPTFTVNPDVYTTHHEERIS
jgi:D-3-phosphoglycerate dehydrogenase / 2-oxoglutarate reductase